MNDQIQTRVETIGGHAVLVVPEPIPLSAVRELKRKAEAALGARSSELFMSADLAEIIGTRFAIVRKDDLAAILAALREPRA